MRITTYEKGGNLLNPFIKLSIFLMIILCLFIIPVSALTYENLAEDPVGLGYYSPTTALEIESTRGWITVFNPSGAGSLDVKIYDLPNPEDAVIGEDGFIYFVLRDGRVFQCIDYSYTSFVDDYNTSFIFLGDMDALTLDRSIVVDSDNNVYSNSGLSVYIFTAPYYSKSILKTLSLNPTYNKIESLGNYENGLIIGVTEIGTRDDEGSSVQVYNIETDVVTEVYDGNAGGYTTTYLYGVYSTANGDIYFLDTGNLKRLDNSDSYAESTISVTTAGDTDIIIDSAGIIYVSNDVDDTIVTYSTIGLQGGYSGGIVGEIEGSYINWDSSFVLGDTGSYTWGWDTDDKSFIRSEKVKIYKDGVLLETNTIGDTGTRYFDLNEIGTYSIKLVTTFPFTQDQIYASDYIEINEIADSWINVPQTTAIKENFTTTYMYGVTPISPIINVKELQNDYTYKIIDTKILPSAIAGTVYTTNLSISSIGNYVIDLYDNGQGKSFATDFIQTNYVYIPPSGIIGSSYINTTDSIYSLGGVISGNYAIDDTNYTDYYTKLQVYNIDKDIISFSFEPLHQLDNLDIPISEYDIYTDGENLYPVNTNFLAGQNSVRLASYNIDGSLNEVITQKNITLSITDNEGYGLTLSKYIVDENEIFAIKAITPVQASIIIHPLSLMGVSDYTIIINGTTQISHAIGIKDTYLISLISGDEVKATQIIKVFEGEEIIDPSIDDEIIPDTTFQDNTTSLLNSPYLIGLFIMCVFLAIGAPNGIGGTIVTGSIGLGIVCYMGIFPWILLVIEVLVVAVLMAKGMINLSGD